MNIVFFTQEDPFYVKLFFDEFLQRYSALDEIKAVVISRPMGKKSYLALARQMYGFYGLRDFVKVGLRYAYFKMMSRRPAGKAVNGKMPRSYSVKQAAEAHGLNVVERDDLNSLNFRHHVGEYRADLFISVASPVIFKRELISIPRVDCINIHNAPLPRYRGMLPNFWQLYHGETSAGITIHRINPMIDRGDIIAQHQVPIDDGESLHDLIRKTKKEGAHLMMRVIEQFRMGAVTYRKMEGNGSYFSFPSKADVREFKRKGKRLL